MRDKRSYLMNVIIVVCSIFHSNQPASAAVLCATQQPTINTQSRRSNMFNLRIAIIEICKINNQLRAQQMQFYAYK